jgi:hypothetical protein
MSTLLTASLARLRCRAGSIAAVSAPRFRGSSRVDGQREATSASPWIEPRCASFPCKTGCPKEGTESMMILGRSIGPMTADPGLV